MSVMHVFNLNSQVCGMNNNKLDVLVNGHQKHLRNCTLSENEKKNTHGGKLSFASTSKRSVRFFDSCSNKHYFTAKGKAKILKKTTTLLNLQNMFRQKLLSSSVDRFTKR